MDSQTKTDRAQSALEILEICAEGGSQKNVDTLLNVIKTEGLWTCYTDNNGRAFNSFADFLRGCERELGDGATTN